MLLESSLENFLIYYDNLSIYYVGSVVITLLSVIIAWWHTKSIVVTDHNEEQMEDSLTVNKDTQMDQDVFVDESDNNDDIISKIKKGKQSLLAEKVASKMTEDQLKEEKEVERQQLEAILQLLQTEEDKFQVTSLDELEDQLKLYRL